MLSGKYLTVDAVIERVHKDYGFDMELNRDDVIEWVYEAMDLIGAVETYNQKLTDGEENNDDPIVVTDYLASLPDDLHELHAVIDADTYIPLVYDDNPIYKDLNGAIPSPYGGNTYRVRKGYIETDMESGELILAYSAIQLDGNRLPMIPDESRFFLAVVARIAERIAKRMYIQDRIAERKFRTLEQDWLFYVKSARTKALMPNKDGMQNILNRYNKLLLEPGAHATYFRPCSTYKRTSFYH